MRSPWISRTGIPAYPYLIAYGRTYINHESQTFERWEDGQQEKLEAFRLVPGVDWFAGRKIVEDKIDIGQHLREQDDLAGVH